MSSLSATPKSVLFLCTGNSARSIMAEAILNHLGRGRFRAYSAGSHPTGKVNPLAIETLRRMALPVDGLRSKSWNEFARVEPPVIDFIFTVCDSAASEVCPIWPGSPTTAHWGVEDPAAFRGSDEEARQLFYNVALTLKRRIELFLALPFEKVEAMALRAQLRAIGKS